MSFVSLAHLRACGFFAALLALCLSPAAAVPPSSDRLPVFGKSVQIDPGFPYYQGRSPESVASEIRASGYRIARYVLTADSAVSPDLIAAFHREGIGVWYMTFGNGTYTAKDLPPGWEQWRMTTRRALEGQPPDPNFIHLCLNHPEYRAWKKRQVTAMLRNHPFQGIDIVESHWPEYPGVSSPAYACFCVHCLRAFRARFPEEAALPDILHPDSPRAPKRNPELWRKWLEFRRDTVTGFLNELVNGDGGIRQAAPGAKVCTWTLALSEPNGVQRMREDCGQDAAAIALIVRPDMHCFQTNWPDWVRAELPPDYARNYRPFVADIRKAAPRLPLMIQADTGSQKQNRRDWTWIRRFERTCREMGVGSTTFYEYFLGRYLYTEPPRIAAARPIAGGIALHFTKRLDPQTAGDIANYAVSAGTVRAAEVDGSIVRLTLDGARPGQDARLTARGIADAAGRRFYADFPPVMLKEQTVRFRVPPRSRRDDTDGAPAECGRLRP